MWSEMTDHAREEYKDYFIRYHNSVAKTGITGKRIKPATVLPQNVVSVFEKAILTKVMISAKKVSHVIKFRNLSICTLQLCNLLTMYNKRA